MRGEVKARDNAIASLETKLSGVVSELEARDEAIANLNPEPTPEPEPTPTPNQTPEPKTKTKTKTKSQSGTVGTPGLVEYINSIKPGSGIIAKTINNAITRHLEGKGEGGEGGKGKNLSSLESRYNFKYLGKVANSHQFSIPKL